MKRLLAILLVISVLLMLLVSCKKEDTDDTTPHEHSYADGKCECGEDDPNYVPPHEHTYTDGKCACGAEDPNYVPPHEHNYVDGKCECGEEDPNYVPPHEHNFVDGKCECGEEDPDYEPPHEHNFVDGKCECGEEDPDYEPPHEHNYVDGKCACGEEDPDYEPPHEHKFLGGKCECGEEDPDFALHNYELYKIVEPTCQTEGMIVYKCSDCGNRKKEKTGEFADHDYVIESSIEAKCYCDGENQYKCSVCGMKKTEVVPATGEHVFDESTEASRILRCSNSPCTAVKEREFEDIYGDQLKFTFSETDKERFYALHAELDAIIKAADPYDPALHAYVEGSDLDQANKDMEAKYEELYDVLEFATGQYQIAQIEYHMDMQNEEKKANYDYITEVRTQLIADFYTFSKPLYDSMYREYYYHGMTEEEIQEFLYDSDAVGNEEYKAVVERNKEIELEFDEIADPTMDGAVLDLYEEFVENNNKIAEIMGYENYLEYAYKLAYDRDYTYQEVQVIREYVKEYVVPIYLATYAKWNSITSGGGFSQADVNSYYYQVSDSFFEVYESNRILNDYIDLLTFTSNPDKQISFSDEFNKLMSNGNLFRGQYEGAYVTSIYGLDIPIAFFGPGYDNPFTVAHEFGHYMNQVYGGGDYSQSFDLLEMHSQGNEILYLAYLSGGQRMTKVGYELCKTYNLLVMLDTVVTALAVDTFEQAIYTNFYDGENVGTIMDDGKITSDEYDALFNAIIADFGTSEYTYGGYWRYVTIHAPCYYVSYSVSALSVLQLYPLAMEDFEAAKDSYLKLFTYIDTYTDEDDYMTVAEVLEYAGMYSYTDEELYKSLYEYLYTE